MWKGPLAKTRCLIPAVGWYEWKTVERADPVTGEIMQVKQPHFFHLPDDRLFSFAGIMAMWKAPDPGAPQLSAALFTQDSIGPSTEVHERMPIILTPDMEKVWLDQQITDPGEIMTLARKQAVIEVLHHPVSSRVSNAKNDDKELVAPVNAGPLEAVKR